MSDESLLVPILVLLSSGLAAVALDPRNRASQLLLVTGVAGFANLALVPVAVALRHPSVSASLLRTLAMATGLLAVAALALLMLVFPDGRFERTWHRRLGLVILAIAAGGPVLALLTSPSITADGDDANRIANVVALPGLTALGSLGELATSIDPVWFLVCFVVLLLRYRGAERTRRRELLPMVVAPLVLVLLLVPVLVELAGGPRTSGDFVYVFRAGLAVLPVVLLLGLSRRSRLLAGELAASRARIVAAEDAARRRIERDLHDGVQQQLVALLSLTELAARQARSASPRLSDTLDDVREQLTTAVTELRELVYGIRPPVLADAGVADALESRMRRLPREVTLDLEGARGRRWSAGTEAAAYFVACEAVTNALKHAPGALVRVRVADAAGDLHVVVEDAGPGLRAGRDRSGTGLAGMRDRVDSLGGRFTVGTTPAGGTRVQAMFVGEGR